MKERTYLKDSVSLCGKSDGGAYTRKFTIVNKISEGASVICYEAYHSESGRGVLKEFYPNDTYILERNEEGQLIPSTEFRSEYKRYQEEKQRYLEPYELLLSTKQKQQGEDMSTFIPSFEIYNGCDERGNVFDTVYIWSPEPKLETFEKICSEIHRHPADHPEKKLFTVLHALETLTRCVCTLHQMKMVHRDIKPSNFGFMKRGSETLTQSLSLFDVNTVCFLEDARHTVVGTEGFLEPEAGKEWADNQTDVYAIGATLFYAIAVTEEAKKQEYHYRSEDYGKLSDFVDNSELLKASEANYNPKLRAILTRILQKCLSERGKRYDGCEELLKDLGDALFYVLPPQIAKQQRNGQKWVLADVEKALDQQKEKNSFLSILYHLYKRPLYQCLPAGEDTIRVLVIGFGNYGQKFLDACLQAGQNTAKNLQITVVSNDEEEQKTYCGKRPALKQFFAVNGAYGSEKPSYGSITFETRELSSDNGGTLCKDAAADYAASCASDAEKVPHYVFIALGDDEWNQEVAGVCSDKFKNCVVNYVRESVLPVTKEDAPLSYPLCVNENGGSSQWRLEVARMAFNTHLIWTKDSNLDYNAILKSFRKKYNYESCVANVLSLKYKLYDIGIDLEQCGCEEAAKAFQKKMKADGAHDLTNRLMWLEHRRWVTEKICQGWQTLPASKCKNDTKDAETKRHVCLVRSEPNQNLAELYTETFQKKEGTPDAELDELDTVSVQLQTRRVALAKETRKKNLLAGEQLLAIRSLIQHSRKSLVAFQEWFTCMKDIWDGDHKKVRLYGGLKNAFLRATETLAGKEAIQNQVKAFDLLFSPVLAAMEYRDLKKDDVALIENIPFTLLYTKNAQLVIPYATGYREEGELLSRNELFGNVAAPTALHPAKILYLYLIKKEEDLQHLKTSLSHVKAYSQKKQLKAEVEFLIIQKGQKDKTRENEIKKELRKADGRIKDVSFLSLSAMQDLSAELEAVLAKRKRGKKFFAVEMNETALSVRLEEDGFYDNLPHYRFDSLKMKFDPPHLNLLLPLGRSPYITVTDMIALDRSTSISSNQPEFYTDHRALWDTYRKHSAAWKELCKALEKYLGDKELIASFERQGARTAAPITYILPAACSESVSKLLPLLMTAGCIGNGSVSGRTTDSCEVTIGDYCGQKSEFDRLFANVYKLMDPEALKVLPERPSRTLDIRFDELTVSGFTLSGDRQTEQEKLLEYFRDRNYLIGFRSVKNITANRSSFSFTFASKQIKELLSCAGKILEVHTFHEIKESGYFDDVVSNFEILWEGTEVKNEFDCIATKGFRSLFIECKARVSLESEPIFKLKVLRDRFGINALPVLIADTQEQPFYNTVANNTAKRRQGEMTGLITVWDEKEINEIGETLKKIIDGEYEQKLQPVSADKSR